MHAPRPYAPGGLDVSVADGGTGASTAAAARTNLGIDPLSALQSNLSATTAPTANDDSDDGYSVGSTWINVTTDEAYVCLDATVGAAVWENTTTTGSGAPVDASYVTMGLNGTLTAERVLTGTVNQVVVTDDYPGAYTVTLSLAYGIDATRIGGGGVTSTVFGHLGDVTSYVQAQLDAKQPLDADLTAISGLGATAGMLARTATDTFAVRTIAGTANEITFTNGDGAAGAPTAKVERDLEIVCIDYTTDCAVGDGKGYITVPKATGSKDLAFVHMAVITAGTTGSMTVQIHNETDNVDMLSSPITLDSGVKTSITAAIDNTKDDVVYGDVLRIDVDAVHTTPAKGLIVTMHFA